MKSHKLLVIVVVLQGLLLAGQWSSQPTFVSPAHAQIPDAGNQRLQMIEQLKELNQKMDRLTSILQDGRLQVVVTNSDDNEEKPARR
jgi:outer membrane murein-binding lipoprotein Lpp